MRLYASITSQTRKDGSDRPPAFQESRGALWVGALMLLSVVILAVTNSGNDGDKGPVLTPDEAQQKQEKSAIRGKSSPEPKPQGPEGKWDLIFSEDFEGPLNPDRWNLCYPTDSFGCTNAGNAELEWYVPENVEVDRGLLRLTARQQEVLGTGGKSYPYTSGMVSTGPPTYVRTPAKFAYRYGYAEARVRVPAGKGLWPAFWLLPESQQWPPEIDVFEVLGHEPRTAHLNNHWSQNGEPEQGFGSYTGPDFSADFHVFGVEWDPDRIVWYVDGVPRRAFNDADHIPAEPMFLVANLAVGGTWAGDPSVDTRFPATYELDFMRVWQRPE